MYVCASGGGWARWARPEEVRQGTEAQDDDRLKKTLTFLPDEEGITWDHACQICTYHELLKSMSSKQWYSAIELYHHKWGALIFEKVGTRPQLSVDLGGFQQDAHTPTLTWCAPQADRDITKSCFHDHISSATLKTYYYEIKILGMWSYRKSQLKGMCVASLTEIYPHRKDLKCLDH